SGRPQVITPRRLPNDPMLPYEAPTRTAGRSWARWRNLYHRSAVLFIGQPKPAVSAGSAASISQPAKAVSTSSCDAPSTSHRHRLGPSSAAARGPGAGQRRHTFPLGQALFGVQTLETADVQEEDERPQAGRRPPRHVADDIAQPGHPPALRRCRLDRGRHVVDAHGLPPPPRQLGGVLTAAAAQVQRTAERAGALGLLTI